MYHKCVCGGAPPQTPLGKLTAALRGREGKEGGEGRGGIKGKQGEGKSPLLLAYNPKKQNLV